MTKSMRLPILAVLAAAIAPTLATAGDTRTVGSFDPETGRNLLNYPAHRLADIQHMKLEVEIADMNKRELKGVCTLVMTPIARDLSFISLNAGPPASMHIQHITVESEAASTASFTHEGESIDIAFTPPISLGKKAHLVISYSVVDAPEGLIWTVETPAWPGRAARIHSQGESESNRYWFPSFDLPNERFSSELYAVVPKGNLVVSNGLLANRTVVDGPGASKGGYESFHWVQAREHVNYLVSMVVGKLDVVDVGTDKVPMPVYVPPGKGELVKGTFGRTPKMVALFGRLTGQPYPWDKYAQVCVTNFGWGGMENTSATTLYEDAVQDKSALPDGDKDDLISHELAHQWFGDLMTCNSWEHIWLNEGFATYFEKLWSQYRESADGSNLKPDNDAYQWGIWNDMYEVIKNDEPDAPYQPAMVSKEYENPNDVFEREANPYPKGSAILHMLREKMGDEVFFAALAAYVARNHDQNVETFDLRKTFEVVSGLSLQRFFEQWCYRPGVPRVEVTAEWNSADSTLTLTIEQKQKINGYNPAFAFELPVWVKTGDGAGGTRTERIAVDSNSTTASIKLPAEPTMVVVDPNMSVLAEFAIEQPSPRLVAQLRSGPTLASKLQAADQLGRLGGTIDDSEIAALIGIARDNRAFAGLRSSAINALGKLANPTEEQDEDSGKHTARADAKPTPAASPAALTALLGLSDDRIDDAAVRRTLAQQLAHGAAETAPAVRARVAGKLAAWAKDDASLRVRADSLRGLGTLKATEQLALVLASLEIASFQDQIRQGAIDAIARMDQPDGLDSAIRYAAPGHSDFTRSVAVKAIGKLAHHNPDRAFSILAALIQDTDPRTQIAAADTIAKLPDTRALDILQARATNSLSRSARHQAEDLVKEIKQKQASDAAGSAAAMR